MTKMPQAQFYILDAEKHIVPANEVEWMLWFGENVNRRHVAYTEFGNICVSTIFVGFNLRIVGDGPPLIFETMVFRGDKADECMRYSSWDDAETGHRAMVARMRGHMQ